MKFKAAALALLITLPAVSVAQESKFTITPLTDNLYMLESSAGGNIGLMVGPDGTFLIDDQMAPVAKSLMETIENLGGKSPRFLLNTHYHRDHTGGNAAIGNTSTTIISHDNTRKRLNTETTIHAFNVTNPPASAIALPIITFSETLHLHINGETVRNQHFAHAHTDGDSATFFENANVVHTGDIFFNGLYPFIDTDNGGSLMGVITAVEKLITSTDANTKIIPGHGPLANRADLIAYKDMLNFAHTSMRNMKGSGIAVDEVIALKPMAKYDAKWGQGLFSSDKWIRLIYPSL